MSFFSKILTKLGLRKEEPAATATAAATVKPAPAKPVASVTATAKAVQRTKDEADDKPAAPAAPAVVAPTPISEVDVLKKLEQLSSGSELNWKVSIVDLLKILDIDSSRDARNELATELGCPAELMKDSAKMNVWLHKEVLKRIAQNGGNIPQNLLD